MSYVCKHFRIEEMVSPHIFKKYGQKAWQFFDPRILMSLDGARDYFGRIIFVNTWLFSEGRGFKFRGLRESSCEIGAEMSQHRLGNAADYDVEGMPATEVRLAIRGNQNLAAFRYINCLEDNVNWVHMDCRNLVNEQRIKII